VLNGGLAAGVDVLYPRLDSRADDGSVRVVVLERRKPALHRLAAFITRIHSAQYATPVASEPATARAGLIPASGG